MAEFSKEYAQINGYEDYDFSYSEILEELENGQYTQTICEGLGTFGAHKRNDIYYLVVSYDGALAEYSSYIQALKEKNNNLNNQINIKN